MVDRWGGLGLGLFFCGRCEDQCHSSVFIKRLCCVFDVLSTQGKVGFFQAGIWCLLRIRSSGSRRMIFYQFVLLSSVHDIVDRSKLTCRTWVESCIHPKYVLSTTGPLAKVSKMSVEICVRPHLFSLQSGLSQRPPDFSKCPMPAVAHACMRRRQ